MSSADLLKRSGALACVGLAAGLGVGWMLRAPAPPRIAAAHPAATPVPAAPEDPIAALVAATAPPAGAETRVAWTSAPERVERREPTEFAVAPADINARPPAAPTAPPIAGAAATRGSAVAETPEGATAVYTRLEVIDGGAFRSAGRTIRLAGIEALAPDETCRDARGAAWPCGRRALAALRDLVRQRSVQCVETGEADGATVARCRVGRTDLSAWLVEQGWARPLGQDARLAGLHQEARSARAGQFGPPAATR
jgi:endonuclease YncB( thermonuclease family)